MSKKDEFIFLNAMEFPTIGKTGKINWKESVGRFINFERVKDKQRYQLKIEEYINDKKIRVLFEDRKEYLQLKNLSPNNCNLTEYLTKRTFQRETIREEVGNDGKPREIKGFGEFHREKMKHL